MTNKSKSQLEKSIDNAVVFVPKDKETKSIYFSDKGVRLTTTEDRVVIETAWHSHVFESVTSAGVSNPFLYTRHVIALAVSNNCLTEDGYSFSKLLNIMKEQGGYEYNILVYYEWWLMLIFNNLYAIGDDVLSCWIVFFKYITMLATTSITLDEHKEDLTNKHFVELFKKQLDESIDGVEEMVIIHALTDEERTRREIDALQELEDKISAKNNKDASKD